MSQVRVLLGYTNATDLNIVEAAGKVHNGLFGHPAYPTPPIMQGDFKILIDDFLDAIDKQSEGGPAATSKKNDKRKLLIDALRKLAAYVQESCGNNLTTLLESGFEAVSSNRASSPLATPGIREIINGHTTELIARLGPVANAKTYEGRCAVIAPGGALGPWQTTGLTTNSRGIIVPGLTPGTNYQFQFRAIGGATGYSDWSVAMNHMCM